MLSSREATGGSSAASDAGAAGEVVVPPEGTAGEGGAGSAGTPERDSCPTRFESVCSPEIALDNKDAEASGALFTSAVPDANGTLTCIARDVCNLLFRRNSEVRNLVKINMVIEDFDGVSAASAVNGAMGIEGTIRTSSRYLQAVADAGGDVQRELYGVLYYQTTNLYQNDDGDGVTMSWLVQGVANFTRHAAGHLSDSERKPGGKYDEGGYTTGFFLVWLDRTYPDFVYEMNQSLAPDDVLWSPQSFQDITGQSVDDLWSSYQAATF